MSQMELIPAAASQSLSPIIYKDIPCISTEMLAQAYDVGASQIKMNFSNNKERFIEGKHYFLLKEQELSEFRNLKVKSFYLQISPKTHRLTLWTERGAARHAKMLNSDKAWDVFEMLEETFFNQPAVSKKETVPAPALALSTTAERLPLRNIVNVWANQSRQPFADCWRQVKAAFSLSNIKDLPTAWLPDAVAWVQKKIDALAANALPSASDLPALPADAMPDSHKQIERALRDALGKLDLAYQLQNFYGTRNMMESGDAEYRKFLHISSMSNINAAAACLRAMIALK